MFLQITSTFKTSHAVEASLYLKSSNHVVNPFLMCVHCKLPLKQCFNVKKKKNSYNDCIRNTIKYFKN